MRRVLAIALAFACGACGSPTDSGSSAVQLVGTWTYSGTQSSPPLAIQGTLRIDRQDGDRFTGAATFSETDVQGTIRNRTAQVSGRVSGGDVVDFDVFVDAASRRHVARISASDSMSGSWAYTGVVPQITGTFVAKRLP